MLLRCVLQGVVAMCGVKNSGWHRSVGSLNPHASCAKKTYQNRAFLLKKTRYLGDPLIRSHPIENTDTRSNTDTYTHTHQRTHMHTHIYTPASQTMHLTCLQVFFFKLSLDQQVRLYAQTYTDAHTSTHIHARARTHTHAHMILRARGEKT